MKVGTSNKMKVSYFINLENRQDRRDEFTVYSSGLAFPVERIKAIDSRELTTVNYSVPTPIAACWESHQKVAKIFLSTDADHCFVFEDDVRMGSNFTEEINKLWSSKLNGIDLLQIGYCIHSNSLSNRFSYSWQQFSVRLFAASRMLEKKRVQAHLVKKYGYSFQKLPAINKLVAVNTFELGTHAYIISRKFAEFIVHFNNPVYLPADLAMMEMSRIEKFKSYRLLNNLLQQSDSPSSISNASNSPLERILRNLGI